DQLGREPLSHRLLAALARRFAKPAHRERHPAHRPHFDGHLEVRATDAAALHFAHRARVRERLIEDFERIFAAALFDLLERAVDDPFGDRLLAARHQHVDELGDVDVRVLRIRQDLALRDFSASWHRYSVPSEFAPSNRPASPAIRRSSARRKQVFTFGASTISVSWRRTWTAPACGP